MSRICLSIAGLLSTVLPGLAQLQVTHYPIPPAISGYLQQPQKIVVGPDGNLWFTEYQPAFGDNRIGRISTSGQMTEFPASAGLGITAGPDGALWYVQAASAKVGRVTTSGVFTEYPTPAHFQDGSNILAGPDGNLWMTSYQSLVRISTAGIVTGSFGVPHPTNNNTAQSMAVGPDGNLWITEGFLGGIAKMTSGGVATQYVTDIGYPYPNGATNSSGITAGADGALWFAGAEHPPSGQKAVGRITTSGAVSYVLLGGSGNFGYTPITTGPDGNLWIPGSSGGAGFVRITPAGQTAFFATPTVTSLIGGVVTGPDGCLWFTQTFSGKIGQACLPGPRVVNVSSANPDGAYLTGAAVAITIAFSAPVVVAGSPTLSLNSGGTATYTSGSGSNVLTFTYTVGATDSTPRLDSTLAVPALALNFQGQTMALRLNGGTIRDGSGNNALLLLPVNQAAGSLSANKAISINPADSVPPVSAAVPSPGPNANGWNRTDVTVAISVTDLNGSGVKQIQFTLSGAQNAPAQIVSGAAAAAIISAEGITTITYFATDNVGNVETAKTLTVQLDKTAPNVTFGAATPPANAAGWNNSDVSIPFTVTDPLSGVETSTTVSPLLLTTEGSAVTIAITVTDRAGNTATWTSPAVKIDKTRPVISGSRAPLPNLNGWNNADVTVSFACSDGLSGLAPGSPPADTILSSDGANQSVPGTCHDVAGNTISIDVSGISIDKTPPAVAATAAPAPNAAGWNNTNVLVTFAGTDSLSGIAVCAPSASLATEGAGQSSSGTCTDKAGNISALATASGINIDKTPPVIGGSRAPAANAAGWNNTDVIATFTCSDSVSGLTPGNPPTPVTITVEGANQSVARTCQDVAGNSATYTVIGISVDKTPPTASGSAAPAANAAGWNNTTVTVSFAGSDSLSGIAGCTAPVPLASEGAGQSASGTCTDKAGNSSSAAAVSGINIDKTPPAVTFGSPAPTPNAAGWNNSNVSVPFTVADSLSGMQSTIPVASPLSLTTEGAAVAGAVTATDRAGNTSTFSSPAVKIDRTAPVMAGSRTPAPNANGWNNTNVTVAFTCADALAGVAALNPGSPVVVSSEGANQTVAGTCQDLAGNAAATTVGPINLDKTKPVADVTANPSVVPLNTGFTVNATVTDLGSGAASAEYRLDNGPYSGLTLTNSATGLWSDSLPPLSVGVYTICARSIDRAGIQGDETCVLVPVYDPTGGFVTGGGWITSPPGAYAPSPSLTGKASFAFSAKYQHGANLPSGDTQFRFQAADFLFRSSTYQWLVVAGARAQFKGSGTINGSGDYQFLLTAIDGEVPGGGGEDKFRIKIWNAGGVVYDNKMGSDDGGNDATTLGGGSIVIHK